MAVPARGKTAAHAGIEPAFAKLWTSTACANLGDGLILAVIPLLAIQLTNSSGLVAGAKLAHTLPWAVAPLFVGLIVDRMDRRQLVIAFNLLRVLALAALFTALAWQPGTLFALYLLYLVAAWLAVGEAVTDIAVTAIVPAIVRKERLEWANSRIRGAESVLNEFAGQPLGGLLIALSPLWAVGTTGGLYLAAACTMIMLHGRFRPAGDRLETGARPAGAAPERHLLTGGLRILWRNRPLRTLTLMSTVMAGCWSAWLAVLVLYTVGGPVGLTPTGYGLLMAALGAGAVIGAVLAPPIARILGIRWILAADVVAGVVMLGTPAATADVWTIGLATFVGGLGGGLWNVAVISLRQRLVPGDQLGRISGAIRFLGWGGMPVGAALAAVLVQLSGPRPVFALCALLTASTAIPLLRMLRSGALGASAAPSA